jgi:hypothetical protein
MAFRTSHSRRWARSLSRLALAAALLAVLYVLMANVVLAAELRSMTRDPRVEVRYGSAHTLLPGRVHIERLEIEDRGRRQWRVLVDEIDLRMSLLGLLSGSLRVREAEAAVRAIGIGNHEVTGRMWGRVEEAHLDRGASSLRSASLVIPEGEIRREGAPSGGASFQGSIVAGGVSVAEEGGVQLTGALHVEGADAGALLDVASLPEAARWALEGLDGQAFTMDSAIDVRQGGITLRDLHVRSAPAEVRGTLRRRGDLYEGAFLVRRGRFTTGIELEGNRVSVVLAPDGGWLSRKAQLPPLP